MTILFMYFKTDELQQEMLDDVQKKLMNLVTVQKEKWTSMLCLSFLCILWGSLLW